MQMEFREGRLPTECTCQKVVLTPKGNYNFRGIGMMEVLWNTMLGMIKLRIRVEVQLHGILHVFWVGRGMGTDSLEANLLQNLTAMMEEFL